MNENLLTDNATDVPWATSDQRLLRTPEPPMPAGSEKATSAAGVLKNAVQGAHDTLDRFADRAEPAARRLGERVADAEEALHAKTAQLREKGDVWAEGMRATVRSSPLTCVAAAFALGAVLARITR